MSIPPKADTDRRAADRIGEPAGQSSNAPEKADTSRQLPPADLGAEQALLGVLLRAPRSRQSAATRATIKRHHFADPIHGSIFAAANVRDPDGEWPNLPALCQALDSQLNEVGGTLYLHQLVGAAPSADEATVAAGAILDTFWRRQMFFLAEDLAQISSELAGGTHQRGGDGTGEQAAHLRAQIEELAGHTARLASGND